MKEVFDMQKQLELTIRINEEDFEVDVHEPESGDIKQFQFPYSQVEHPEFVQAIGAEIYSWIRLWEDEMESDLSWKKGIFLLYGRVSSSDWGTYR